MITGNNQDVDEIENYFCFPLSLHVVRKLNIIWRYLLKYLETQTNYYLQSSVNWSSNTYKQRVISSGNQSETIIDNESIMVLHNPGILSELRWVYPEANMKLTHCMMIHNIWVKWLPIVTSLIMWLILWNRWASVLFGSIEDYIMMMLKLHDFIFRTQN